MRLHGVDGCDDLVLIVVDGFQQEVEPRTVGVGCEMSRPSQVTVVSKALSTYVTHLATNNVTLVETVTLQRVLELQARAPAVFLASNN